MEHVIIFDTETTGFEPSEGHHVVEIGALEMIDFELTGKTFHQYINPQMPMPESAYKVHGLDDEFLAGKPVFADIAETFIEFIGDATLVAHNASFDMKFIQAELRGNGFDALDNHVVDTLLMARQKFPNQKNNLDMLAQRLGVDISARAQYHGALLDSQILAQVYLLLSGKGQPQLLDSIDKTQQDPTDEALLTIGNDGAVAQKREMMIQRANDDELALHQKMRETLGEKSLWNLS